MFNADKVIDLYFRNMQAESIERRSDLNKINKRIRFSKLKDEESSNHESNENLEQISDINSPLSIGESSTKQILNVNSVASPCSNSDLMLEEDSEIFYDCNVVETQLPCEKSVLSVDPKEFSGSRVLDQGVFPCLPSHGKTLTRTRNEFQVRSFCPENPNDRSDFVYIGLEKQQQLLINAKNHEEKKLKLQFNMDGLPLINSGGVEFWPILGKVHFHYDLYDPFIIAAYKGIGKPAILSRYLDEFVKELNHLLENGVIIECEHFEIEVMCFICDTPARAFIKNISGHTGFYACERCTVKGSKSENRTIFPSITAPMRTDESFRTQKQPEHHNGVSPLLKIVPAINMIFHFSLDFMHLC